MVTSVYRFNPYTFFKKNIVIPDPGTFCYYIIIDIYSISTISKFTNWIDNAPRWAAAMYFKDQINFEH